MFRLVLSASLGLSLAGSLAHADADLPNLHTDRGVATRAMPDEPLASELTELERLRAGTLELSFMAIDYRFAGQGLQTNVRVGGSSTRAIVGFGDRRLELDWRADGGNIKFAVTSENGDSGYRLEYVRSF